MVKQWNHTIGEVIKSIRTQLGESLTQQQFADKVGVSRSLVAHAESKNHVPQDDVLIKIASTFSWNAVEYDIMLNKLRKAALYTKNPSAFEDAMTLSLQEGDNDRRLAFLLPEYVQFALQDALLSQGMSTKELASRIFKDLENSNNDQKSQPEFDLRNTEMLSLILSGRKSISLDDFRMICDLVKCDSAELELTMGLFPKGLKNATRTNRALVKMLTKLNKCCEQLNTSELTEYVQQIALCMSQCRSDKS